MPDTPHTDEVAERAAEAIRQADSGSNHGAGMDGDDDSAADQAQAEQSAPQNGR